jgi:hypothetical protein
VIQDEGVVMVADILIATAECLHDSSRGPAQTQTPVAVLLPIRLEPRSMLRPEEIR